jgi:hypothetical protein
MSRRMNIKRLTKEALKAAKDRGVVLGNPRRRTFTQRKRR